MSDYYSLLTYSLSSVGILALLYKIAKNIKVKSLSKTYFQDKVVLVTGASSGLGKAIAEELYPLGAQLIICARNVDELNKVKASLMKSQGKEPEVLGLDVSSDLEVMKPKIDQIYNKFKRIDILINNAGITFRGEVLTSKEDVFKKIMDVNFFGTVRLTNLVVNQMVEDDLKNDKSKQKRRNFAVVNIGSVQSYLGIPYRSAYCSSKHALLAFSDSLRGELYEHKNIDIINIQPGYVNTNISINALTSDGQKNNSNDDDHRNGFDPNHVAKVLIYSILKRENEVLVAVFLHRAAIWLRFFMPNLFSSIMYKWAAKKPSDKKFK